MIRDQVDTSQDLRVLEHLDLDALKATRMISMPLYPTAIISAACVPWAGLTAGNAAPLLQKRPEPPRAFDIHGPELTQLMAAKTSDTFFQIHFRLPLHHHNSPRRTAFGAHGAAFARFAVKPGGRAQSGTQPPCDEFWQKNIVNV